MNDYPFIRTFQLVTGNYIYDVNKNSIIKIKDEQVFKQILEIQKFGINNFNKKYGENNNITKDIDIMIKKGYLKENIIEDIVNPTCNLCNIYSDRALGKITLQVTQDCNLKCSYCPYAWDGYMERMHNEKYMTWDTAKKSIDLLINNSLDTDKFSLHFYGGEPLLNFNLIKKSMLYICENIKSKPIQFGITTNGTLLTRDVLNFFKNYDIYVYVSIDGPEYIHNKNRKFGITGEGSYSCIRRNMEIIHSEYSEFVNKVSINSVWDGSCDIKEIEDFFSTDTVLSNFTDFTTGTDTTSIFTSYQTSSQNHIQYQESILDYFVNCIYSKKLNFTQGVKEFVILYKNMTEFFAQKDFLESCRHRSGSCIPGHTNLFVDVYGNFYPCEKVTDKCMQFGNIHLLEKFNIDKMHNLMNICDLVKHNCMNCWAIRYCNMCAVVAANNEEISVDLLNKQCEYTKKSFNSIIKDFIYLKEFNIHSYIKMNEEI